MISIPESLAVRYESLLRCEVSTPCTCRWRN